MATLHHCPSYIAFFFYFFFFLILINKYSGLTLLFCQKKTEKHI